MNIYLISLREGLQFSLIILLLSAVYSTHARTIIAAALSIMIAGAVCTFVLAPVTGIYEKIYSGFSVYAFLMILFLSLISGERPVYAVICLFLALFLPSAQMASVINAEAFLREGHIYVYAITGILTSALVFVLAYGFLPALQLRKYFNFSSVMVFIAMLCFLMGGVTEFGSMPVVPVLQKGLYGFISGLMPTLREIMLIPPVGVIVTPAGEVVDYLTSERVAMALTVLVMCVPPVYVFLRILMTPEPDTGQASVNAERRKILSAYTDVLLMKGTPIFLSLLVSIVMIHAANLAMSPVFDPEPVPVIAEGSDIIVPFRDIQGDMSDGRIRKYSLRDGASVMRFMVMMKPDGKIFAGLDACEICPPEGYIQRGEHLVCKYCSTPVALSTLGMAGGCNPIPLPFSRQGEGILIKYEDVSYAYHKWVKKDN